MTHAASLRLLLFNLDGSPGGEKVVTLMGADTLNILVNYDGVQTTVAIIMLEPDGAEPSAFDDFLETLIPDDEE